MEAFIEEFGLIWGGFLATISLASVSGALALIWGTLLAAFRVSPIGPLRTFGTVYVEIVRNTPLTLMFFFWCSSYRRLASSRILGFRPP